MREAMSIAMAVLLWNAQTDCEVWRIYAAPQQAMIMLGNDWVAEVKCSDKPRWEIPEHMRGWHFAVTAINELGESYAAHVQDIDFN